MRGDDTDKQKTPTKIGGERARAPFCDGARTCAAAQPAAPRACGGAAAEAAGGAPFSETGPLAQGL